MSLQVSDIWLRRFVLLTCDCVQKAFGLSSVRSCAQWNWSGFSFQSSPGKMSRRGWRRGTWELRVWFSIQHSFTYCVFSRDFECVKLFVFCFQQHGGAWCYMSENGGCSSGGRAAYQYIAGTLSPKLFQICVLVVKEIKDEMKKQITS